MKNSTILRRVTGIALLGAVLAIPAGGALADAVSDFYRGNQVKVIVGGTAGGGYAPYSRMLQRHMGRHIPGKPQTVIQYMPGAGGLTATNFIANAAPKDGTVIGAVQRSIVRLGLFGGKRVAYDPRKLQWLGSLHQDVSVCVAWHSSPIKTIQDAFDRESVIGAISPNNDTGQFPLVLNNVLGTKFKIIFGYKGSAGITLAIAAGRGSRSRARRANGSATRRSTSSCCCRCARCRTCPACRWRPSSPRLMSSAGYWSSSLPSRPWASPSCWRPRFRRTGPAPCARPSSRPTRTRRRSRKWRISGSRSSR